MQGTLLAQCVCKEPFIILWKCYSNIQPCGVYLVPYTIFLNNFVVIVLGTLIGFQPSQTH
jgi:hypothetical protein